VSACGATRIEHMFEALSLSDATADGRAIVSLAERIDKLAAVERARKALEAEQVAEMGEFCTRRLAASRAAACTDSEASRGAAAEIALALGISPGAAEHQMHAARSLVNDHPEMFALMAAGEVSFAAARRVHDETMIVSADTCRLIDAELAAQVRRALPTPAEQPVGADGEAGWSDEMAFWGLGGAGRAHRRR